MILAIATVKFGGNFCFSTTSLPPELRIAEASETLGVPSKVCTTSEGFGMLIAERSVLSKYSSGTFIWPDNSCNPFTSASFLIDANLATDFGLSLNFDNSRYSTDASRYTYNPFASSTLGFTITQPLLQGFGIGTHQAAHLTQFFASDHGAQACDGRH